LQNIPVHWSALPVGDLKNFARAQSFFKSAKCALERGGSITDLAIDLEAARERARAESHA